MTSNTNQIFEKTSFLQGTNSSFIKELYFQYLQDSSSIPQSWKDFFDGLDEDSEIIKKEILGPSWNPKKNIIVKNNINEEPIINSKKISLKLKKKIK